MQAELIITQRSFALFAALIALDALILSDIRPLSDLAGVAYLFFLPGLFLLDFFRIHCHDRWQRLIHTVALSLVFLLLAGLLADSVGALARVSAPLSKIFYLFTSNLLLFIPAAANYLDRKRKQAPIRVRLDWRHLLKHLSFLVLPATGMIGTALVNNHVTHAITFGYIALVSIAIVLIALRPPRLSEGLVKSAIYCFSLSLLLLFSMRAWHVTGYDISKEYRVFTLTHEHLLWNMRSLQDPYNACLSITILPTIISEFLPIDHEYIFKFLFQCVFALMPVALYGLVRLRCSARVARLSTLFVIAQIWFFANMPTLNRQEFSLLFFTLTLGALFDERQDSRTRRTLAMAYGIGMVLSHYSTTYIALTLFTLVFILNTVLSHLGALRKRNAAAFRALTPTYLVFLFVVVFAWNALITRSAHAFSLFLEKSAASISEVFTADTLVRTAHELLYPYPAHGNLADYVSLTTADFRHKNPWLAYYPDEAVSRAVLKPAEFIEAPRLWGDAAYGAAQLGSKLIKILVNNIFIVFGISYVSWLWLRRRFPSSEFVLLGLAGFGLLIFLIILPDALEEYNIERLYFQMLIIWAMFGAVGGLRLLRLALPDRGSYALLTAIYVLLFLFYTGFISEVAGGVPSYILTDYGENYEKFYVVDQDVAAARWLDGRYRGELIFTSSHGINRLSAFSTIPLERMVNKTLPGVVSRDGIVFASYINTRGGKSLYSYLDEEHAYSFPIDFFNDNKDKVYSNGVSIIYR